MSELQNAMFAPSFPCNPIPFANGIVEGCQNNGSDFIKSDEGKRILFVLNAIAYGQLATIDMIDEYNKLDK